MSPAALLPVATPLPQPLAHPAAVELLAHPTTELLARGHLPVMYTEGTPQLLLPVLSSL